MRKRLTARPAYPWRGHMPGRLRRGAVLFSIVLAGLLSSGGIATAAPSPTPDEGLTGACNMTNTNASFGMFTIAGSVANPNGFDVGMIIAILNTNGGTIPDNCQGP
jgi:hypothetical protein